MFVIMSWGLTIIGLTVLPETTIAVHHPEDSKSIEAIPEVNTPGGIGAGDAASSSSAEDTGTTGTVSRSRYAAVLADRLVPGELRHGIATLYETDGTGACMLDPSDEPLVAAMNSADYENSRACGAFLKVTGPSGNSVTVQVTDECPDCAEGALDLSAEAFAALESPTVGRISVSWELLSPVISGPISLRYKSGSGPAWCAIQVINHRNPVATVEFKVDGSWTEIPRQDYNYFVSEPGAGCGGLVRVTDVFDQNITIRGLELAPGTIQEGPGQFSRH
jgi:expansin (peptidoglycan-binding protein)